MQQVFYFDLNDQELLFHKYKQEIEDMIIRNKNHVAKFLIKIVKLILFYPNKIKGGVCNEEGILQIFIKDRIKRVFYVSSSKITSVYFPFYIATDRKKYIIKYLDILIDEQKLICIEKLINDENLFDKMRINGEILDLQIEIESALEDIVGEFHLQDRVVKEVMRLYLELLILEDGYIRFEEDETREHPKIHPRFHFDIFYTNGATFKLGASNKTTLSSFIDLLNLKTECFYLQKS